MMSVTGRRTEIPSETDAIAKASNNVINNTDFNLATKKAATKRIKQAVAENDHGETQQLQARRDHHEA